MRMAAFLSRSSTVRLSAVSDGAPENAETFIFFVGAIVVTGAQLRVL